MREQERFERTVDKTRRGGLPANTHDTAEFLPGSGNACAGCAEVIAMDEELCRVNLLGVMRLCFHHECYVAWSTYKR
jgi:hypothetical protein